MRVVGDTGGRAVGSLKILYCTPSLGGGGAERHLCYVAARLAASGHEVHVAYARGGVNLDRLRSAGVGMHEVGGGDNHDPRILLRLVALIRRLRPDVVQTNLVQMDVLGGAAALLTRTPWVLREASCADAYPPGWKSRLRVALGRRAAAVTSISAGGDDYWRAAGARRRGVILNGVPFDELEAAEPAGDRPWLGAADRLVLFAGRMESVKNVEGVVRALALIAGEVPFVAALCGDGPLRAGLERLARESGLGGRLVFPGYVNDLWGLMKRADVFVCLSRYEGGPNVVLEAAACGCPLVLSDIPTHRAALGGAALFAGVDDAAGAAGAIRATLLDREAARGRAAAARRAVAGRSVEESARLYEQLYRSLLGGD
jgi:glycosyltransferase involved in cell wall biosynthesis